MWWTMWTGIIAGRSAVALRRRVAIAIWTVSLALFPTSSRALTCGQSLTANTRLTADLVCSDSEGPVLAAPGITLDLAGYEIRCTKGSPCSAGGSGALAGVVLAAPDTTVRGPGRITGFLVGVWDVGEQVPGTTVERLIIDGTGPVYAHGIYGIENIRSNVVFGCGTALRLLDNALSVQDNLIAESDLGVDIAGHTAASVLKLIHNRIVACGVGLSLGPGSSVNSNQRAIRHNILIGNTDDLIDQSDTNDIPLATNVCVNLHPLSTSGMCSTSPILPDWPSFKP
ncbi:MAG TPA: hypothetical protein VGK30_10065 [Candidatus Binatia bacterium]|jgi:hypothetical protein